MEIPLRSRLARRLPMAAWLLIVIASIAELWMIALTQSAPAAGQWGFRGYEAILALSFGSVGALIAARRPENRVGWVMLASSAAMAVQGVVDQYPVLSDSSSAALPGVDLARWIAAWAWTVPTLALTCILPLLFPTGRLLSPRWQIGLWLGVAGAVVHFLVVVTTIAPVGPIAATAQAAPYFERAGVLFGAGYVLNLAAVAVSATSLVVRYQRGTNDERLQLKWVALSAAFLPITAGISFAPVVYGPALLVANGVFAAVAMAIAILRYRLYEIDLILNRALVYGALSAILAGVYTASITLSQRLFITVTQDRSDAAIVITTLIVAATFTPVKTRLQAIVDRRIKTVRAPDQTASQPIVPASTEPADDGEGRLRRIIREEIALAKSSEFSAGSGGKSR